MCKLLLAMVLMIAGRQVLAANPDPDYLAGLQVTMTVEMGQPLADAHRKIIKSGGRDISQYVGIGFGDPYIGRWYVLRDGLAYVFLHLHPASSCAFGN